jgi:hypothetical protein
MKTGLDDYLCNHSVDEFKALPKKEFRKQTIPEMIEGATPEDYRDILNRLLLVTDGERDLYVKDLSKKLGVRVSSIREDLKAMKPKKGEIDVDKLLELEAGAKIRHPGQTFHDRIFAFGGIFGDQKVLIRADGDIIQEDKDNPFLFSDSKLSGNAVRRFKDGDTVKGRDLIERLNRLFSTHVFFKDPRIPLLLSLWVMGTYLFKMFRYYGYVLLNSPVKRCAKSLVLDILSLVSFNATSRQSNPTEAVIFRQVSGNSSTLVLDEVETLGGSNHEKNRDLIGLLNAGFQYGSQVMRMEGQGKDMKMTQFDAYSPKALAGLSKIPGTIEDRSFRVVMVRRTKEDKVERFNFQKIEKEIAAIRDDLYVWSLSNAGEVGKVYGQAEKFRDLESIDDRQRDILEPLLSIAGVIDLEIGDETLPIVKALTSLALSMAGERAEIEQSDGLIPAAVAILKEILDGKEERFIPSGELLEKLRTDEALSFLEDTRSMARFLRRIEIYRGQKREGAKRERGYTLKRSHIEELGRRYG